jgi:transposase
MWAHCQMLLTTGDRLWSASSTGYDSKMTRPTDRCRVGLQRATAPADRGDDSERIRHRLWRFYDGCAHADMDEATRLAITIETWWPAIQVALTEQVTNARAEGFNRIIKQVKRVGCGFTNMDNCQ